MSNVEDAEKEYTALLKQKTDKIKAEMAESARIEQEKTIKAQLREEVLKEINQTQPSPIDPLATMTKKKENGLVKFAKDYTKRHGLKPVEYGSTDWQVGYDFTDSDTGCDTDVSSWTPAEVFSNLIWSSFYCKGYLAGKVTVRGVDFARGAGDTVSIRTRGKRTAQGPLNPCECLSCVSESFSKYQLTLDAYGDLAKICEMDLQLAGDVVKDGILQDMADALAEEVDLEIWNQLVTSGAAHAHMNYCCSGPSLDACCFQAINLYNLIIGIEAGMRTAGYHPDYVIMSPALAAYFKYKEAVSQQGFQISFNGNELSKIGSMSIIEFPCATTCSTVTDTTVAVVLDSSHAVGEGWGKKPTMEQDRNIDCDSTTVAIHMYAGIDELDTNAIYLIKTPVKC